MMFVAFSYSARLGSDLRVDALIGMLPQGCRNIIEIINLILCIMVAGFLFYHSFGTVAGVMETGEASVALKLPMQYVYAASVVGYGLGTVRYIQRLVLFILGACGTGLANLIGYGVSFTDSIPGLLVLIVISMIAVFLTKVLPLKLPIVAYCSIIGLISACPLSPVREFVIQAAGNINFTAPSPWWAHLPGWRSVTS